MRRPIGLVAFWLGTVLVPAVWANTPRRALLPAYASSAGSTVDVNNNVAEVWADVLSVDPVYRPPDTQDIVAYDVQYRYHGDIYVARLKHDPGDRLRVRVSITPLE